MADDISAFFPKLPEAVAGWTKVAPPAVYTPATLSRYIDGGAELFISYNLHDALSLKYAKGEGNEISVDIFDMSTSSDAFGVFAHSREADDRAVGQGSEYAAGLLTFWKDRYYISILAYPETAEKKEVVFQLARTIAGEIKTEGPLPPILSRLPAEDLIPESVHYFHHYIWLNSFCFVSNENVLNIAPDTPAVLGKYRQGGKTFFLLLVHYPDEGRAEAAHGQFLKAILAGSPEGMREDKDGRWTGCGRKGSVFGAVLNAPDAPTVKNMLAKIIK